MSLVLVRIDCRLIHGQVLETWVPHVRSDCVLVADDQLASNELQKTILCMSVPGKIHLEIDTVETLVRKLLANRWEKNRVLLLFSDCQGAQRAFSMGLHFTSINLGNVHFEEGCRQVTPSVALSRNDLTCLRELSASGVQVECRAVPNEKPFFLEDVLRIR
ncbi:MAG: PTS sugar transporter subunit IIB [Deltaproteobacteria bacterium]|nr:PTS sugar transporter subunit IIB [Deltaproteobacteria bacterium]